MQRLDQIALAALALTTISHAQTPLPPLGGEPPLVSPHRDMGLPQFATVVLDDSVPVPLRTVVRAGERGDELLSSEREDPHYLGFVSGRHYPPADERLDPQLVAAAASAAFEGRNEVYGFVMFQKRMTPERAAQLETLGARVLQFHPYYCLKAALPTHKLDELAALDFVRWIGVPQSAQKLHPELVHAPARDDGRVALYVDVFESDLNESSTWTPAASASIVDGGVAREITDEVALPKRWQSNGPAHAALVAAGVEIVEYVDEIQAFRVLALPHQLEQLVALDCVQFVEPDLPKLAQHEESTPMIGADYTRYYYPGNTSGTNAIAQCDSGVDVGHGALQIAGFGWDFTSVGTPWNDGCEHGTHVIGSLLGDGWGSFWTSRKGVAPNLARGGSATRAYIARLFDNGCVAASVAESTLFSVNRSSLWDGLGWTSKPQLSNNSWGSGAAGWFGSEAPARAVDSEVWNYDQVYVFSAGNSGWMGASTLTQQAAAKNSLAVANVIDYYGTEGFPGTAAFDTSRGPCGDGRWKPNVAAPGDSVLSCDSGTTNGYRSMRGTSMATPHVSGLAAQLTDVFTWLRFKPAGLMSVLMSSAETKGNTTLFSPLDVHLDTYGAGKISGHKALLGSSDYWWNTWNFDATWSAGATFADFNVPANCKRITVCMNYVEPEASAGASQALINNWNLWVDDPTNGINASLNAGDFFSQQSAIDNVEIRGIDFPAAGTWRWKVWPQQVNFLSHVKMSVTVTYEVNSSSSSPALDVYTSTVYAKPNTQVDVFAMASNGSGLASCASLEGSNSGAAISVSQGQLLDGPYTDYTGNPAGGRNIELGDIPPGASRSAFWRLSWPTEGVKNVGAYLDVDNTGYVFDSVNVTVDGTNPPHPSISSTSHTSLVWSNDNTIDFTWTQTPDNLSGIAGYATVVGSLGVALDPGHTINLGPVTSTTVLVPSSTLPIYYSMRPIDNAGNSSVNGYAWSPPYRIDAVAPGTPGPFTSTHTPGLLHCSGFVNMSWAPVVDLHSGVVGYLAVWDTSPSTVPTGAANLGNVTNYSQGLGASGAARYFHLRAVDAAGNLSHTAHFGPIYVNSNVVSTYCTAKTNSLGCVPAIGSSGLPQLSSASGLTVTCSNVLNQKSGLLFWGSATASTPFQGGFKCVADPVVRSPVFSSGGPSSGNSCTGGYSFAFTPAYMNSYGLTAGTFVCAQWWMRDPASSSATGLSNGLSFTVCQ